MKRIEIELSVESCQKAIDELTVYKDKILPRLDEVCKRLAYIGCEAANAVYARASADTAETGNVPTTATVVPMSNGKGYKIVAKGEDVYFIEFGTGNSAGMFYGDGLPKTNIPVYPGSYSEQHAGMYAKWGYWFYNGELMSSTEVYMPMYYAGKAIRENEKRIVEEVFSK